MPCRSCWQLAATGSSPLPAARRYRQLAATGGGGDGSGDGGRREECSMTCMNLAYEVPDRRSYPHFPRPGGGDVRWTRAAWSVWRRARPKSTPLPQFQAIYPNLASN